MLTITKCNLVTNQKSNTINHIITQLFNNNSSSRTKLAYLYPKLASLVLDEDNLTLGLNEEYVTIGKVWKLKEGNTPDGK